ncbi:DUF5667 domain-containing protein [Cytobacillus firmus]|uniref:DUF5667 domain-containing protein n=1 Tax=Cytobacillus firmus TaxID=1399 RepID=UPI00384C5759
MKSLKFLSGKEMNKMAKSTLAVVIAGAFTFSGTAAFASGNSEEADFETVELKNDQSAKAIAETNNDEAESIDDSKEKLDEIESETPSLLPGSFFYFAKLALEKVKLALTFDDVKEAKLLAGYAAERMAEAEALFAEGKEEEALAAIEKALEQMENAENIVEEANEDSEQSKSDDENSSDLISEDESAEDEASEEDVQAEDDVDDELDSDNDTVDKETEEEVKEILAQNIITLKANLAKFSDRFHENHPAILAMQKNIAKFSEKWSDQLIGLEKGYAGNDQDGQAAEEPEPVKSEEAFSEMESADDSAKEIDESASEEEAVTRAAPVKVSKESKNAAKAEKKKAHEEAKVLEANKRAEAKAAREEARKAAKEQQAKKVEEKQTEAKSHASKGKERAEQAKGQGKENKGN